MESESEQTVEVSQHEIKCPECDYGVMIPRLMADDMEPAELLGVLIKKMDNSPWLSPGYAAATTRAIGYLNIALGEMLSAQVVANHGL